MAFLLLAVVASALGIAVVLLRHRRPASMDASIRDFERSLRAISPGAEPGPPSRSTTPGAGAGERTDDGGEHPG